MSCILIILTGGEFRRYAAIALPLSKPVLTTVGIYAFINAWSDYLALLIYINKTEKLTLSLGLQGFLNQYSADWTHLMAAATDLYSGGNFLPVLPEKLCGRNCNFRN